MQSFLKNCNQKSAPGAQAPSKGMKEALFYILKGWKGTIRLPKYWLTLWRSIVKCG